RASMIGIRLEALVSLIRRKSPPIGTPKVTIPPIKPPGGMSLPVLVLMIRGVPSLKDTVTGEAVLSATMGRSTRVSSEIGLVDVATIEFGEPRPVLVA